MHKYEDKAPCAWQRFVEAMHSGEEVEIDEEMYYYWLEVLPPVFMNRILPFPDPQHPMRYDFGFAEGAEKVTVFWHGGGRYFCRRTDIMNPHA